MKLRPTYRAILGSFRVLRRRALQEKAPGLTVWADTGEQAALSVQLEIRDGAHRAETSAQALASEVREIMADGKVTNEELLRLTRLPSKADRIAEVCHGLGEVVS